MSDTHISGTLRSTQQVPLENSQRCCSTATIIKISLIVFGVLLIGAALAVYLLHVNAIAAYCMGGVGGILIIATLIVGIVQCVSKISQGRAEQEAQRKKIAEDVEFLYAKAKNHQLAQNGDVVAMREALSNNTLIEDPVTLLNAAAFAGQAEVLSLLIEHGADLKLTSERDDRGYSALHLATICPDPQKGLETMRVIIKKEPSLVSQKVKNPNPLFSDVTPLHLAAGATNKDLQKQKVQLLVDNGAEVNAVNSEGYTPLHEECCFDLSSPNIDVIEILLKAGADPNAKDKAGETPFEMAQRKQPDWYNSPEIQGRLKACLSNRGK